MTAGYNPPMAFKREKRLTRRERKEQFGPLGPKPPTAEDAKSFGALDLAPDPSLPDGTHIHCVACGKHLDTVGEARARQGGAIGGTLWASLRCAHGSVFQACLGCMAKARRLLDDHDRSGRAVAMAEAWH